MLNTPAQAGCLGIRGLGSLGSLGSLGTAASELHFEEEGKT